MKVLPLQEAQRQKLKALASEREELYKRYTAVRNEYDALLVALVKEAVPGHDGGNTSYRLDDNERFLVLGQGGEWKRL